MANKKSINNKIFVFLWANKKSINNKTFV